MLINTHNNLYLYRIYKPYKIDSVVYNYDAILGKSNKSLAQIQKPQSENPSLFALLHKTKAEYHYGISFHTPVRTIKLESLVKAKESINNAISSFTDLPEDSLFRFFEAKAFYSYKNLQSLDQVITNDYNYIIESWLDEIESNYVEKDILILVEIESYMLPIVSINNQDAFQRLLQVQSIINGIQQKKECDIIAQEVETLYTELSSYYRQRSLKEKILQNFERFCPNYQLQLREPMYRDELLMAIGPNYDFPEFPNPPPMPSDKEVLPTSVFQSASQLSDYDSIISLALNVGDYSTKNYYTFIDGFALVTQIEKLNDDASPFSGEERWRIGSSDLFNDFSLAKYFKALFFAKKGYYRIFVFLVTSQPLTFDTEYELDYSEAQEWLNKGLTFLPPELGNLEARSPEFKCTVLVYEFKLKNEGESPELFIPFQNRVRTHLLKTNVWAWFNK